jgi:hypothetical protein
MSLEDDLFRQRVKNMVVIPKEIYDKCLSHWDSSIRDAANSINIRQMNNFCTNKDDKTDLTKKVNIKYIDKDGVGTGQVNVQDDKPRVSNKVRKKPVVDVSTQTPIPYVDVSTQTPSDQSVKENIGTQSSQSVQDDIGGTQTPSDQTVQDDIGTQSSQTVQDDIGTQSSQSVQNEGINTDINTGIDFSQEEKNARIEADNIATDRLLDEEEFDRQQQQELQKPTIIEVDQELQKPTVNVNTSDISMRPIFDFQLHSDDDDDDDYFTALSDRESMLQEIAPKLVSDQFENTKWENIPEPNLTQSQTDYLSNQHLEKLKKENEKFKANIKYKMRQRQRAKRSERFNRHRFKSLSPLPEEPTTNDSPQKVVNTEVNTELNTDKDSQHDEVDEVLPSDLQVNVATIPTEKVVMSKQHLKKNNKDNEKYKLRQHQRAKRNDRFNRERLKSLSLSQEVVDMDQQRDEVLSDFQPNLATVPTEDDFENVLNPNSLDLETNVSTLHTEDDSLLDLDPNISTVRTKGVESNTPEPLNNKYNQLKERINLLKQQYINTFNSYNALPNMSYARPKKFILKKKLIRLDRLLKNAVGQLHNLTNTHKFNRLEKKVPIVLKRIKRRNIIPFNKKVTNKEKDGEKKNSEKINSEEKQHNKDNSRGQKRKAKDQVVGSLNQFNNKKFKKKEYVKKNNKKKNIKKIKKKGKMKVKKSNTNTIKGKSTKVTPTKNTSRSKKKSTKKDVSKTIKGTPIELIPTKVTTRSKQKNVNKDKIVKVDKDVSQIIDLKNITSKPDLNAGHLADYTNLSRKSRKKNKILEDKDEDEDEDRSQKSRGLKRKALKQPFGFQFQATKKRNIDI